MTELALARLLGKRVLGVVVKPTDYSSLPPELTRHSLQLRDDGIACLDLIGIQSRAGVAMMITTLMISTFATCGTHVHPRPWSRGVLRLYESLRTLLQRTVYGPAIAREGARKLASRWIARRRRPCVRRW